VAQIEADGAVVMQMLNCVSSCRLWLWNCRTSNGTDCLFACHLIILHGYVRPVTFKDERHFIEVSPFMGELRT